MSQPAAALAPLPFELVYSDGEPLETHWHVNQISLFQELVEQAMTERGRSDYFVGGNMFVYYSYEQAHAIAADINDRRHYRGPDIFYVGGVEPRSGQKCWVVWEEGRYPEVIVELLSPSTARTDRTVKKDLYARVFRTPEYFLQDPDQGKLEGFRLTGGIYQPILPNAQGRLRSERLGLELGLWDGVYRRDENTWVRLFDEDGRLVPTADERAEVASQHAAAESQRAEAESQRAGAESQRADAAEAEVVRLRALLGSR
ncbi:MAG: Uma2 family endonuclease [Thermoanaerobaculia bacterium]